MAIRLTTTVAALGLAVSLAMATSSPVTADDSIPYVNLSVGTQIVVTGEPIIFPGGSQQVWFQNGQAIVDYRNLDHSAPYCRLVTKTSKESRRFSVGRQFLVTKVEGGGLWFGNDPAALYLDCDNNHSITGFNLRDLKNAVGSHMSIIEPAPVES